MYPCDTFTLTVIWSKIEGTRSQCVSVKVTNSSRLGKGLKKGICLVREGLKNPRETFKTRTVAFFWPDVTGQCWVQVWVESWVVKFWQFWAGFILLWKASEYKTKNFYSPCGRCIPLRNFSFIQHWAQFEKTQKHIFVSLTLHIPQIESQLSKLDNTCLADRFLGLQIVISVSLCDTYS